MISLGGLLLGLINICIVVAILILAGLLVSWALSAIAGIVIPEPIRRVYLLIVALIAVYMIVALLFGMPTWRLVGGNHHPFRVTGSAVATLSTLPAAHL